MDAAEEKEQLILDKVTKCCLCKGIPRIRMKEAIRKGARTVQEVNQATGSGSGPCGGRRCSVKITEMLKEYQVSWS